MRVSIGRGAFTAKLAAIERDGWTVQALLVDGVVALTPEDLAILDCSLTEISDAERDKLIRAGFIGLLEH